MIIKNLGLAVAGFLPLVLCFSVWPGTASGQEARPAIRNPYYQVPAWKLWCEDPAPVGEVSLPPEAQRLFPWPPSSEKFIDYRPGQDWPGRTYAGFWFDVYSSEDNKHSYVRDGWKAPAGGAAVEGILAGLIHLNRGSIEQHGINFTSQSTTEMGHHLTNEKNRLEQTERDYYFRDCLRTGPAHISFMDRSPERIIDEYQALVPCFYNSVGSSGSETMAITKMLIAGGYLPAGLKRSLQVNGLYPATLLYIWKAALPYKVPYDDELRHRVAYNSQGDHADYRGSNQTEFNHLFHNYNDELHLRNMVKIAAGMDVAPPVALLKPLEVKGGTVVYDTLKTAMLVQQGEGEEITVRLSVADSYDLQGRPLTFRWKVLYGQRDVKIRREGDTPEYTLTIPADNRLPKGRTSILLIASNGRYDSNPAVVNIYRTSGKDNLRPTLAGLRDLAILPGETASFRLSGQDPEGFPVTFSQWDGEVGRIEGDTFTWQCPPSHPAGVELVTVIVSDGSAGNGYNSGRAFITVSPTVACLTPDPPQGPAPLRVVFSSEGSRDLKRGQLRYEWNFDDGVISGDPNPVHTFTKPGFYEVSLTVTGPSGRHTVRSLVRVEPQWPLAIENGWGKAGIDRAVWQLTEPDTAIVHVPGPTGGFIKIYDPKLEKPGPHGLTSVESFSPPLYLEASFFAVLDNIRPGSGFSVLGTQLGYIEAPGETGRNISIGRPLASGAWESRLIARKVRFPWQKSVLKLFLDSDPNHPGRFRYTGFLESDTGEQYFRFDNQELPSAGPISIVSGSARSRFELYSIRIWTEKKASPVR